MESFFHSGGFMIDLEKERTSFEEWYAADSLPAEADWFKRDPSNKEEYFHEDTASSWKVWLARAHVEYRKTATRVNGALEQSILDAIAKVDRKGISVQTLDLSLQETTFSACGGQLYTFLSPEPYDPLGPAKFGIVLWIDRNEIRDALQQTLCTKSRIVQDKIK